MLNLLSQLSQAKVVSFAKDLRDKDMAQKDLHALFSNILVQLDGQDLKYDLVADALDQIVSGPWAKGKGLFPKALKE